MSHTATEVPDLASPAQSRDPYPAYNWLRENDPAHWSPQLGAWVLSRYDDVRAAFRDQALSSDRVSPVLNRRRERDDTSVYPIVDEVLSRWIVFTDPPAHSRLRKLVEYAFRPRAVQRMEGIVQTLTDELMKELEDAAEFDFIEQFANPLPVRVIAGMLDVPREFHDDMARWSDEIVMLLFGAPSVGDRQDRAARGLDAFATLVRDLIEQRRDAPGEDLISDLIVAREHETELTEEEIVATCVLLLFAGHETTRNLLANGVKLFLEHPSQLNLLLEDSERAAGAVEEVLRFEGPIKAMWRLGAESTTYQGREIAPGERVLLLQAAANRDPRRFELPDEFDILRSPNRHVAFGYSIHYCLGAAVARLEGTLGFRALAPYLPRLEIASTELDYQPFVISRTLCELPLIRRL
ncbi:MAG: cytochrome P450 [Pseudomonadota bacterium]